MRETIEEYKGFTIVRDKDPNEYVYFIHDFEFRWLPELDLFLDDVKEEIEESYIKRLEERIDEIRRKYTKAHKSKGRTYFIYYGEVPELDKTYKAPDEVAKSFITDKCDNTDIHVRQLVVNYSDKRESAYIDIVNETSLADSHFLARRYQNKSVRFERIKIDGAIRGTENPTFEVIYDFEEKNIKIYAEKESTADRVAQVLNAYALKERIKKNYM